MGVKPILFVIALLLSSGAAHSQMTDLPAISTTTVEYSFGGGEMGSDYTIVSVRGDGLVKYQYTFPLNKQRLQEKLNREKNLSKKEVIEFYKSLMEAGVLKLRDYPPQCCDIPSHTLVLKVPGNSRKASSQILSTDPEWNAIISIFGSLLKTLHPE